MVEYVDGSVLAQMGIPDMAIPISYILAYPERLPLDHLPSLDLPRAGTLAVRAPDLEASSAWRSPTARCARAARHRPCSTPPTRCWSRRSCREIAFLDIPRIAAAVLDRHETIAGATLEQLLAADAWARDAATGYARGEARAASA